MEPEEMKPEGTEEETPAPTTEEGEGEATA